jgi:hypothetical protein
VEGSVLVRGKGGHSSTWATVHGDSKGGGVKGVGGSGGSGGSSSRNRSGKGKPPTSPISASEASPQCLFVVEGEIEEDDDDGGGGGNTLHGRLFISPFNAYEGKRRAPNDSQRLTPSVHPLPNFDPQTVGPSPSNRQHSILHLLEALIGFKRETVCQICNLFSLTPFIFLFSVTTTTTLSR